MSGKIDVVYATGAPDGEAGALDEQPPLAVRAVGSPAAADREVAGGDVDCVVTAADLPEGSWLDVVETVRERDPEMPIVVRPAADADHASLASEAVHRDVDEYLPADVADRETLRDHVAAAAGGRDTATGPGGVTGALLVVDDGGVVVHADPAVEGGLGYDPADIVGDPIGEILPERYRESHEAAIERALAPDADREGWRYAEFPLVAADGTPVPVAVSVRSFGLGERRYFAAVVQPGADRFGPAMASLFATARRLMEADSREAVAETLAESVEGVLGFEMALVRLFDAEAGELVPAAMTDATAAVLGDRPTYAPGEGHPGEVFASGEPAVYEDVAETDSEDVPDVTGASIYLPIGSYGTLSVGSTVTGTYDEADRHVAELLTSAAAAAIERVEREAELRTYETVLETVGHHVFMLDERERFTLVTGPLADLLGRDRADLEGAHVTEAFDAETVDAARETVRELRSETGLARDSYDVTLSTPDGDVPVEVELSPLPGDGTPGGAGVVGVVRDRTRLAETKAELRDARDRFTYLFENIPDAVVEAEYVDGEPVTRNVNPAFEEVFGYAAETVVGRHINDLVVPEDRREEGRRIDQRAIGGEQVVAEIRRQTVDGRRDFLFRGVPYSRDEGVRGFGIYTDITEQKQRGRRLAVLNRVLRHNLRNEMNLVLGYADRLAEALDAEAVGADSEALEAGEPGALVAALREQARSVVELGEEARAMERALDRDDGGDVVDLAALVRTVVADCRSAHPEAIITADLPETLWVRGGESLATAVEQLVENAVEHSDRDHPRVVVSAGPRETAPDEWVAVRVADDGPGIPAHEQVPVSDEREVTQLDHGSGLGLWVVAWVARSLGGEVDYAENEPRGSVVSVHLQRAAPPTEAAGAAGETVDADG